MILVLRQGISTAEKERLVKILRGENYLVKEIQGVEETQISRQLPESWRRE
jgi:hypothetical protein